MLDLHRQRFHGAGQLPVVDQHVRLRIADDVIELAGRETKVERQMHRADAPRGEDDVQRIHRVERQHADPVSLPDAEGLQPGRDAADPVDASRHRSGAGC